MTMKLSFCMMGPPQPKQRARVTVHGTFTPKATRVYEKAIRDAASRLLADRDWPMDGEYELECRFYLPGFLRGDLDNLGKAVSDGLETVGYANDRSVSKVTLLRVYNDAMPRTEVTLTWLGPKKERPKYSKKKGIAQ